MSILKTFINLPGTIVSGITDVIFGNEERANKMDSSTHDLIRFVVRGGIVGTILGTLDKAVQFLSKVVRDHQQAITIAFWVAFGVAAGVAIAGAVLAAFYPAVLASVVGFSLYGFSIASIAGANVIAQVALASGIAAAAANIVSYAVTAVVNAFAYLISLCTTKSEAKKPASANASEFTAKDVPNSNVKGLEKDAKATAATKAAADAPVHVVAKEEKQTVAAEEVSAARMSM